MIHYFRPALVEQTEAALYLDEQRPGHGELFVREVERVLALLERFPKLGQVDDRLPQDLGYVLRRFPLRRFPYMVVYITEPELAVVAIANHRRAPGYWQERLPGEE